MDKINLPETQRRRRGHTFLPPARELAVLPPMGGQEDTPNPNKIALYGLPALDEAARRDAILRECAGCTAGHTHPPIGTVES